MEPLKKPEHEETSARVANVLSLNATGRNELQRGQAEQQGANERAKKPMDRINAAIAASLAHARQRHDKTTDKLNALIAHMDRLSEHHESKRKATRTTSSASE